MELAGRRSKGGAKRRFMDVTRKQGWMVADDWLWPPANLQGQRIFCLWWKHPQRVWLQSDLRYCFSTSENALVAELQNTMTWFPVYFVLLDFNLSRFIAVDEKDFKKKLAALDNVWNKSFNPHNVFSFNVCTLKLFRVKEQHQKVEWQAVDAESRDL